MSGLLGGHPRRCPLGGRCAVGWGFDAFSRPLTIYAENVESVSGREPDLLDASEMLRRPKCSFPWLGTKLFVEQGAHFVVIRWI